ncbi:hypothetical protein LXL04_028400 [Taraxacum kok-saghyz]
MDIQEEREGGIRKSCSDFRHCWNHRSDLHKIPDDDHLQPPQPPPYCAAVISAIVGTIASFPISLTSEENVEVRCNSTWLWISLTTKSQCTHKHLTMKSVKFDGKGYFRHNRKRGGSFKMAATTDDALDSILSDFDEIQNDFSGGIVKIQSLQSSCKSEIKKREALEFTANALKSENERVMKLYTESINKLAKQLERRNQNRSLKEELKRVYDEHNRKENEFRNTMSLVKYEYENKIKELEVQMTDCIAQKTANESTINQLHQELAAHRNHVEALAKRLDRVHSDVEMTYQYEIQDLKDCLMMEQEEKNGLNRKLQILISRTKLGEAENKQDLSSNRHVETLKQKVMKLRKENELLKRQLLESKEE